MAKSGRVPKVNRRKNTIRLTQKDIENGITLDKCPTCKGTGEYHFRTCGLCRGGGLVKVHV